MNDYGIRINKPLGQAIDTLANYLRAKQVVKEVYILDEQLLRIERKNGLSPVLIYIIDAYVLGEGKTMEIINENHNINCILVISKWNEYTSSAKALARENNIALFTFSELMGAIYYNGKRFLDYTSPTKDKNKSKSS